MSFPLLPDSITHTSASYLMHLWVNYLFTGAAALAVLSITEPLWTGLLLCMRIPLHHLRAQNSQHRQHSSAASHLSPHCLWGIPQVALVSAVPIAICSGKEQFEVFSSVLLCVPVLCALHADLRGSVWAALPLPQQRNECSALLNCNHQHNSVQVNGSISTGSTAALGTPDRAFLMSIYIPEDTFCWFCSKC